MTVEDYTPPDDLETKESIGDDDPDDATDEPDDSQPGVEMYSAEEKEEFALPVTQEQQGAPGGDAS